MVRIHPPLLKISIIGMIDSLLYNYIESVSNKQDIPIDELKQTILESIISSFKKEIGHQSIINVFFNKHKLVAKRIWNLVSTRKPDINPYFEITLKEAYKRGWPRKKIGSTYEEDIDTLSFTRINSQEGSVIIHQAIERYKNNRLLERLSAVEGKVVKGTVHRVRIDCVEVELMQYEFTCLVPHSVFLKDDILKPSYSYMFLLQKVSMNSKEQLVIKLNRKSSSFIGALLKHIVQEILSDCVEIKDLVRISNIKTKVSVHSKRDYIDACGSCIGYKGSRIRLLTDEIHNESVDIVQWSSDTAQYALNALSISCDVLNIEYLVNHNTLIVTVNKSDIPKVVGREGVNIKLASKLTGTHYNIQAPFLKGEQDHDTHSVVTDIPKEKVKQITQKTHYIKLDNVLGMVLQYKELGLSRQQAKDLIIADCLSRIKALKPLISLNLTEQEIITLLVANIDTLKKLGVLSSSELRSMLNVSDQRSRDVIVKCRQSMSQKMDE